MEIINTYYHILGIKKDATSIEIKAAYHKLAKLYHPDMNENDTVYSNKFHEIKEAFDNLIDSNLRKKHDAFIGRIDFTLRGTSEEVTSKSDYPPIQYDFITYAFHVLNDNAWMKYVVILLVGILVGENLSSDTVNVPTQSSIESEQTAVTTNFVYPEWLDDENFNNIFLTENTRIELEEMITFLANQQDFTCNINGYFSNDVDSILMDLRIRSIKSEICKKGVPTDNIKYSLISVPIVAEYENAPVSKDINLQIIDSDAAIVPSK